MSVNNLYEYLNKTAAVFPDKTAFTDAEKSFSFAEVFELSQRLGTVIASHAGTNSPVAVLVERTALAPVMLQAVLASGNYYVPLDAKMPLARMENIVSRVKPAAIVFAEADREVAEALSSAFRNGGNVSSSACQERGEATCGMSSSSTESANSTASRNFISTSECSAALICAEDAFEHAADAALLKTRRASLPADAPAYILFTSGSTGAPKGIVVPQRSVIAFTEWLTENCSYTSDEVFGNQAPFYFDTSVKDLYQTLKLGATCHIFPKKFFSFPLLLIKEMNVKGVTAVNWATSSFHLVAASGALNKEIPQSLRKVVVGGESLLAKHLNTWRKAMPGLSFWNMYGPTEVTVDCTSCALDKEYADDEIIPIGTACADKTVMILDSDLKPVVPGEAGEICVRGGLALGYFDEPEKTAAAFVPDPENPDEIIYRTGDMACEKDGLIYFISRLDGQIKHMGYRIELGEIENTLARLQGVDDMVCLFNRATDSIIAIYTGHLEENELAKAARKALPKYMLPAAYHHLDEFPHNANGKIDRSGLKETYLNA